MRVLAFVGTQQAGGPASQISQLHTSYAIEPVAITSRTANSTFKTVGCRIVFQSLPTRLLTGITYLTHSGGGDAGSNHAAYRAIPLEIKR